MQASERRVERDRGELASKNHGMVVIRRRIIAVIGIGVPPNATHAERQAQVSAPRRDIRITSLPALRLT